MAWMTVNEVFRDEITRLNSNLMPPGFRADADTIKVMQEGLIKWIDTLGEMSSIAQGLNKTITSADKLQTSPTHTLYLLKDAHDNDGAGSVIGMLKVGHKKLFLYDRGAHVVETEPLCVLDFFVLGQRQRHGHGKRLFDHMLKDQGVSVKQLAIDGPSDNMCEFLRKNYGIDELVRQSNNFAVAPEFFQQDSDEIRDTGRSTPALVQGAVGRHSAFKPKSSIGMVIHGSEQNMAAYGATGPHIYPDAGPEPEEQEWIEEHIESGADMPPPRPTLLLIEAPPPEPAPAPHSPGAGNTAPRRDSQVTDQGYFDVKFYHNKLW